MCSDFCGSYILRGRKLDCGITIGRDKIENYCRQPNKSNIQRSMGLCEENVRGRWCGSFLSRILDTLYTRISCQRNNVFSVRNADENL